MTWFQQIGEWFSVNWKPILTFLTSGTFLTGVGTVVYYFKQHKMLRDNSSISKKLNDTVTNNNSMSKDVERIDKNVIELQDAVLELAKYCKNMKDDSEDKLDELENKVNAILEVQSIVYSTINNDSIRNGVSSILNKAKYSTTEKVSNLREEVAKLKKELEEKHEIINEEVEKVEETFEEKVEDVKSKKVTKRC